MPFIYVNLKKLPREMEATTDSGVTSFRGCF